MPAFASAARAGAAALPATIWCAASPDARLLPAASNARPNFPEDDATAPRLRATPATGATAADLPSESKRLPTASPASLAHATPKSAKTLQIRMCTPSELSTFQLSGIFTVHALHDLAKLKEQTSKDGICLLASSQMQAADLQYSRSLWLPDIALVSLLHPDLYLDELLHGMPNRHHIHVRRHCKLL